MNEEPIKPKRKRVVLSLGDKLEVIKLKENGSTYDFIAKQYNIGVTTIKDIISQKVLIRNAVEKQKTLGIFNRTKKTLSEAKRPELEEELFQWISERLDSNDQILTNSQIIRKAEQLSFQKYGDDWKASKGWLTKFKNRYNLMGVKIGSEEKCYSDFSYKQIEPETDESESEVYKLEADTSTDCIEEIVIEEHPEERNEGEVKIEMNPLDAAEFLLSYVSSKNFPLKEIITLQMIRDRIADMQE